MKKRDVIKKREEFTRIIRGRKSFGEKTLVLYYQPKMYQNNRVGISVTTKLGNAVARNRAKRQMRMMIDEIYDWEENFDSIIVIRESFKDSSFAENKSLLERSYKKVKINNERQGTRNA